MRKRLLVCVLLAMLLLAPSSHALAEDATDPAGGGVGLLRFESITSVVFALDFSGSTAKVSTYVTPKTAIDYVVVDAKLYKAGDSVPVKTWTAQKVYANSVGDFSFSGSASVPSRGTYYFTATIKTYRNNAMIEQFTGQSVNVVY